MKFKRCPACRRLWDSRNLFLSDPKIQLIGYQPDFSQLELGLFVFTHASCGTSLAVRVEKFTDLYNGPVYPNLLAYTNECARHCFDEGDLDPCPNECSAAYVREIMQVLRERLRTPASPVFEHSCEEP